jgi:hypothetical protein
MEYLWQIGFARLVDDATVCLHVTSSNAQNNHPSNMSTRESCLGFKSVNIRQECQLTTVGKLRLQNRWMTSFLATMFHGD